MRQVDPAEIIEIEVVNWESEEMARVWFQTTQIYAGEHIPDGKVPMSVRDKRGLRFDFRGLQTVSMPNGHSVAVGVYTRKIPLPDNVVSITGRKD